MPETPPDNSIYAEPSLRRCLDVSEQAELDINSTSSDSLSALCDANASDVRSALTQMRTQLLDLTPRNPLISFKHDNRARCIRLIDGAPDNITQQLYDWKSLTFESIPEPIEEEIAAWEKSGKTLFKKHPPVDEWAKECGFSASHDLPIASEVRLTRRKEHSNLQTLYYPDILEAKISNLYKISRTMVEETGTNPLHLAFGFLEWYEADNSEKAHFAPLFTLPVALEKGSINRTTNTYEYAVRLREDEVQFNASIAVRLADDYAFVLPVLEPELLPEEYLKHIENSISVRFPRWKVHRWGTLAMFNFSRLQMFRDLDPDNWPQECALDKHPLVQAVIRCTEGHNNAQEPASQGSSENEYLIDQIAGVYEKFPLVDVADSSQHSALIDAIEGKNLVIQGPPGTGKSQTITNLIAAALQREKTVLFVSEKLAALEVVKHRMEKLGLGDFCLEIHSHNTKKLGVVESLKRRYETDFKHDNRSGSNPVFRHQQLSKELSAHVQRVNRPWKQTGRTILEILVRCVRYRKELQSDWTKIRAEGLTGDAWHAGQHAETLLEFESYGEQLTKITGEMPRDHGLRRHPWRGIQSVSLDSGSTKQIMPLLQQWNESMFLLLTAVEQIPGGSSVLVPGLTLKEVKALSDSIASMPSDSSDVNWPTLGIVLQAGLRELDTVMKTLDQLTQRCVEVGSLTLLQVADQTALPDLESALTALLKSGLEPETKLISLKDLSNEVDEILKLIDRWTKRFEEFQELTGDEIPPFADARSVSLGGLRQLQQIIDMSKSLSSADLIYRNDQLLPNNFEADGKDFRLKIQTLRKERERLEKTFLLQNVRNDLDLSAIEAVLKESSALKRIWRRDYREARRAVKAVMHNPKTNWNPETISTSLRELISYLKEEEDFVSDERWKNALGSAFKGVDTDINRFDRLLTWHSEIEKYFTKDEVKLFSQPELNKSGVWLLQTNQRWIECLTRFAEVGLQNDLEQLEYLLAKIMRVYGFQDLPVFAKLSSSEDEWHILFKYLNCVLPTLISQFEAFSIEKSETMANAKDRISGYVKISEQWMLQNANYEHINSVYFAYRLPKSPLSTSALQNAIAQTREWCKWLDSSEILQTLRSEFLRRTSTDFPTDLRRWHEIAYPRIEKEQSTREDFSFFVLLNPAEWSEDEKLPAIQRRIAEALEAENQLPAYLNLFRLRGVLIRKGFSAACKHAERNGIPDRACRSIYEYLVNATLADEIFASDSVLRQFDGILHSRKLKDFRQCDQDLMIQNRNWTAVAASQRKIPPGYVGARVSEHTDLALLLREMEKQKRHLPLRQLLRRASKAAQALKPCFMMGPRSVAQYLEPGAIEFDLLIIDEASQMRPAEALGAIARCKQLVVVGDSKQLAPTSFFDRIITADEDEEEVFEAAVSESILDAVSPVFTRRLLRWHYRSRHPSLIAFSNRHFYDNRLMLFPSPHYSGESVGIKFHRVEDGVFDNQVNTKEAHAIADRVTMLILENPSLSLGVATMNAKQKELIDRLIEEHAKKNQTFAEAWEKNQTENEPLFVKNLENVQGDEREVMIISCTYGRSTAGGRVMQRFGPINSHSGGRRLNVLFTRSRTRMEIFSSMVSSDVLISEKSSDGVRALRGMLRYAETGIIEESVPSGRGPDSDFEIAVARMLKDNGYEVDCQIGVAGFFIDLAVKHPTREGEYLLGVECDGAAYHSSKSARDRDRIRQDVLETMGWTIERIWSTDWFTAPEKALQPILTKLAIAEAHVR